MIGPKLSFIIDGANVRFRSRELAAQLMGLLILCAGVGPLA
jgi:hypothetical protein